MYLEELFSLNGKVAVVTGGGKGIGQTSAVALSRAGALVVIFARSDASQTVKMIEEVGGSGYALLVDVTDEQQVDAAFDQIMDGFTTDNLNLILDLMDFSTLTMSKQV